MVDCKDKSKRGIKIEVIECRFKQPFGSKEGVILYAFMSYNFKIIVLCLKCIAKEERIGFVSIEAKKTKAVHRRQLNAFKKETRLPLVRGKKNRKIIQRPARLLPPHIL